MPQVRIASVAVSLQQIRLTSQLSPVAASATIRRATAFALSTALVLASVAPPVVLADRQFGGAFQSEDIYTIGPNPSNLVTGDWNRDGREDIAFLQGRSIHLWIAQPDGSITPGDSLPVPGAQSGIVVADLDDDGNPDLAIAVDNDIEIFRGLGDGRFAAAPPVGLGHQFDQLAVARINHSGHPGLVAIDRDRDSLFVFPPRGKFPAAVGEATPLPPDLVFAVQALAAGDIDGDGVDEVLVGWYSPDAASGRVTTWKARANGHLTRSSDLAVTALPFTIEVADLDGNGANEIIAAHELGNTTVLWNDGHGGFITRSDVENDYFQEGFGFCLANLGNLGRPALVCARSSALDGSALDVFSAAGHGALDAPKTYGVQNQRSSFPSIDGIASAKVDGGSQSSIVELLQDPNRQNVAAKLVVIHPLSDGRLGSLGVNPTPSPSDLLGTIALPGTTRSAALIHSGTSVSAGVVDGDSLIWRSIGELPGVVKVARTDPAGRVTMLASVNAGFVNVYPVTNGVLGAPLASLAANDLLAVGDANGDAREDLLLGNADGSIAVALDDGHGSFLTGPWRNQPPDYFRGQAIGRVVRGAPGVLVTTVDQDTLVLNLFQVGGLGELNPSGVTRLTLPGSSRYYWPIRDLRLADLNGDGNADLIGSIEEIDGSGYIESLSQPDGSFTSVSQGSAGGDVGSGPLLRDLNGDGCIDMVYSSNPESMQGALGVFRNDCTGAFAADFIYLGPQITGSGPVAVGDLDGDGIDDLAWLTFHYLEPGPSPHCEIDLLFGRRPDGAANAVRRTPREAVNKVGTPPLELAILGVFPDPAERSVTVRFTAASASPTRLELYDLGGRRVGTQTLGPMTPGEIRTAFELGAHVAPGIYWLRLTQAGKTATTRIAVVR